MESTEKKWSFTKRAASFIGFHEYLKWRLEGREVPPLPVDENLAQLRYMKSPLNEASMKTICEKIANYIKRVGEINGIFNSFHVRQFFEFPGKEENEWELFRGEKKKMARSNPEETDSVERIDVFSDYFKEV